MSKLTISVLALLFIPHLAWSQDQISNGECSPNIDNVTGSVSIECNQKNSNSDILSNPVAVKNALEFCGAGRDESAKESFERAYNLWRYEKSDKSFAFIILSLEGDDSKLKAYAMYMNCIKDFS